MRSTKRVFAAFFTITLSVSPLALHAQTAPDPKTIIPSYKTVLDAVPVPTTFATGVVWQVGPARQYKKPSEVAKLVRDGDVVQIDAATYTCDTGVQWKAHNLILMGVGGRAVLDATGCTIPGGKGIWNPQGTNLIVGNVVFKGASVSDGNGAGIRFDGGGYLYITNSIFERNQDGVLITPTASLLNTSIASATDVVIDRSEFAYNGGDSQIHNIYVSNGVNSFVLRFSYSHHADEGHQVKSRAKTNYILYNRLADEGAGTASYEIDIPQGGLAYVIGNVLHKSKAAENHYFIEYSAEGNPHPVQKIYVAYNTFVSEGDNSRALFITDKNLSEAVMVGNLIVHAKETIGSGAAKVQLKNNILTEVPGFTDQTNRTYLLTAASPAVNQGVAPGSYSGFSLVPKYEFRSLRNIIWRTYSGTPDLGSFEYVPTATPIASLTPEQLAAPAAPTPIPEGPSSSVVSAPIAKPVAVQVESAPAPRVHSVVPEPTQHGVAPAPSVSIWLYAPVVFVIGGLVALGVAPYMSWTRVLKPSRFLHMGLL